MKRIWMALGIVALGGIITWATFTGAQNAALSARVNHLSAVLKSVPTVNLDEIEARLNQIEAPAGVDEARVMNILTRLSGLEDQLGYKVLSAKEASNLVGQYAAVYGKATARVSGAHLFINFEESNFSAPFFNFGNKIDPAAINAADGIVVRGTVTLYQDAPQIIINNLDQLYLP